MNCTLLWKMAKGFTTIQIARCISLTGWPGFSDEIKKRGRGYATFHLPKLPKGLVQRRDFGQAL
ncbi:MAG TPA: hypothetical protein PKA10_09555 [Selenomonadales bacterium]|nr:hypothetical protein [Selenomonadales bacterium]